MLDDEALVDSLNRNVEKALKLGENSLNNSEDFQFLDRAHKSSPSSQNRDTQSTFSQYFNELKTKGFLFHSFLWNKVLDQRDVIVDHHKSNTNTSQQRYIIPDEVFELHSDRKVKAKSSTLLDTLENVENATTSDNLQQLDRKAVMKKYGLTPTRTNTKKKSNTNCRQEDEHRILYTRNNLNPIDFNNGDFELFNSLRNVLSHQSIQKEQVIENELNYLLRSSQRDFLQDLFERYHHNSSSNTTQSIEEFVDAELETLYQNGLKRRDKEDKSIMLLQRHATNTDTDLYGGYSRLNNGPHLNYQVERHYEFMKHVKKVFESKNDQKIFQENPMQLAYLDPSTSVYHPLAFNHIVFDADEEMSKSTRKQQTTNSRRDNPLPLLPRRQRSKTGRMFM